MAVITRYVVVRNGVELDQVFTDKKVAEAYDRMLDAADSLAGFIRGGGMTLDLDDAAIESLCVFLAKNGPEVTRILKGIKPGSGAADAANPEALDAVREADEEETVEEPAPAPEPEKKASKTRGRKSRQQAG